MGCITDDRSKNRKQLQFKLRLQSVILAGSEILDNNDENAIDDADDIASTDFGFSMGDE